MPGVEGLKQQRVCRAQSKPCQSWRSAGHPKKEKSWETRRKIRKKSQRQRRSRSQKRRMNYFCALRSQRAVRSQRERWRSWREKRSWSPPLPKLNEEERESERISE